MDNGVAEYLVEAAAQDVFKAKQDYMESLHRLIEAKERYRQIELAVGTLAVDNAE